MHKRRAPGSLSIGVEILAAAGSHKALTVGMEQAFPTQELKSLDQAAWAWCAFDVLISSYIRLRACLALQRWGRVNVTLVRPSESMPSGWGVKADPRDYVSIWNIMNMLTEKWAMNSCWCVVFWVKKKQQQEKNNPPQVSIRTEVGNEQHLWLLCSYRFYSSTQ